MVEHLKDAAIPAFARHETFHPRYGWFRKAVQAAGRSTAEQDAFLAEDATVELGVGKNMVRAIRFWGRAAKLLADAPNTIRPRMPLTVPSINGISLFDEDEGVDPYLELTGTLWILHWWMLRPISDLPVWWLAFQKFGAVEFAEDDLVKFVLDEIDRVGWKKPHESSIHKDVSCLLRMYTATAATKESIDDLLDCPMRELGLIEPSWGEKHRYRFLLGPKPTLPDQVLVYACLDWMASHAHGATATLHRLATSIGSPGRAFRLSEGALTEALERASREFRLISITSSAGVPQLASIGSPGEVAPKALALYYQAAGCRTGRTISLGEEPFLSSDMAARIAGGGICKRAPRGVKKQLSLPSTALKKVGARR